MVACGTSHVSVVVVLLAMAVTRCWVVITILTMPNNLIVARVMASYIARKE